MMKPQFSFLLWLQLTQKASAQQGLTLIESIAAIVIAAITLTTLAPPLLYSAATRVQSRNIQQAQAVARQEIDRVRAIYTREEGIATSNPENPPESTTSPLYATSGPNTLTDDRSQVTSPNKALKLDVDGDNEVDVFVQFIRDQGACFPIGRYKEQLAVFQMGVRVYDIAAKNNLGSLETEPASSQLTKSLGQRTTNPLAVAYTEISRSDSKLSLEEYQSYLKGTASNNCP
jgi:prepilin-type N-terminal cleavage/methylation domain-containing protein